jgi:hypothetical protein
MEIPASLLRAHRSLTQSDDRGPFARGLIVGSRHLTGAIHCLQAWGTHAPASGRHIQPVAMDRCGDVGYWTFDEDLAPDPLVRVLLPLGTPVWQITPAGVLRTSRIARYASAATIGPWSYSAILRPDGPAPGIPIAGDSGSICWVRHGARWLALGQVSHANMVVIACPARLPTGWPADTQIQLPLGADPDNPGLWIPTTPATADDWTIFADPDAPTVPPPARPTTPPILTDPPPTGRRVIGIYDLGNDGTDNVILDVALPAGLTPADIRTIRVCGDGPDEWRKPNTNHWWHLVAAMIAPDTLRLWFKQSRPAQTYHVYLNDLPAIPCAPVADAPTAPEPDRPTVPPPDSPLDVVALQVEIHNLRATVAAAAAERHRLEQHIADLVTRHAAELEKITADADKWRSLRALITAP